MKRVGFGFIILKKVHLDDLNFFIEVKVNGSFVQGGRNKTAICTVHSSLHVFHTNNKFGKNIPLAALC